MIFKKTILIWFLLCSFTLGEGYYIYIPQEYRQHNFRASCVFASVTNCLRAANLWKEADQFWNMYKGDWNGENARGVSEKLNKFNIKHKIIHDTKDIISAIQSGRPVAITWGKMHMVNIVGIRNNNAYIVDNQRPEKYIVQPWSTFTSYYSRGGSWGVVILSGHPSKPIEQQGLGKYDDNPAVRNHSSE